MSGYGEHLNYEEFEKPVLFRISADGETILPSYEIGKILRERHGLDEQTECDTALFVDEWKAEFAFDAAVADKESVINDVEKMLDEYNTPPDDLDEKGKEEWRSVTVSVQDVRVV